MVVGLALEPGERAQRADGEHLEVGELALVRHELRQVGGLRGEGRGGRLAGEQIHEGAAVRRDLVGLGHGPSPYDLRWARECGPGSSRRVGGPGPGTSLAVYGIDGAPGPAAVSSADPKEASATRVHHCFSDDELVALNLAFEDAHPREILAWALDDLGARADRDRLGVPGRGHGVMHMASQIRPDVPILFLETGYQFAETLAFKEQLAEQLGLNVIDLYGEYTVEQPGRGLRPAAVRARPRACCDLNKVRPMFAGAPRARRVGHRVPPRLVTHAGRARRSWTIRAGAGPLDREDQPDGGLDARTGVGVPEGARPAAQPAVRPRLRLDRLRAVHAACGSRASPSAPAAGPGLSKWECGIQQNEAVAPE